MQLFALGLNHHTAPLAIRERVAFQPERLDQALHDLARADSVREAAILSTCNRTELYFAAEQPQHAADWLARFHHLALTEVSPYLYSYPQRDAIRHVFRVASGLDSAVIGESEVLIETPFQSGNEMRSVGDQVGVDLPPRRMLFLPA